MREHLAGNRQRRVMADPGPVSILRRLDVAKQGHRLSTYGPTPTHRRSLEIAKVQLAELKRELRELIRTDLPRLEDRLDAAGVPWTPGRPGG